MTTEAPATGRSPGAPSVGPAPGRRLLERPRAFALAVLACMLVAALLRPFPAQFKFRNGGDCVRYLTWSRVVLARGPAAFPALVDEYRHRWVGFPPPTRWLYLSAIAVAMRLWPSPADEYHPIVLISWLAGVLALVPLGVWLRRHMPPEAVVVALLLAATSPVMRALSHFPLPDTVQLLAGLGLFALVAAWQSRPRRGLLVALAASAFAAVTTRETGLFLVFAAAGLALLPSVEGARWREPVAALAAGCVAATVVTVPLAGGPTQLLLLVRDYVHGNINTGNSAFVGGPYYRYLVDFMIVSPVVVVTSLWAMGALLRRPELPRLVAAVVVTSVVLLACICPLTKAIRYAMTVDAALRGLCAAAVWAAWRRGGRAWSIAAVALVVVLVGHDLVLYQRLWGHDEIYDPLTFNMTKQLGMAP